MKKTIKMIAFAAGLAVLFLLAGCGKKEETAENDAASVHTESAGETAKLPDTDKEPEEITPILAEPVEMPAGSESEASGAEETEGADAKRAEEPYAVSLDPSWEYAGNAKITSGEAMYYPASADNAKGITVCVNAGHGTSGGGEVKTLCHPDGTPKVTGGTTGEGATEAIAVSSGTDLADGTTEASANLQLALIVKERLLAEGYDVLMIRESDDVQLDNIARTVIANNCANCHIALHYDGTDTDKGVFFMSVPDDAGYRSMEPVASHFEQHNALGLAVVSGIAGQGFGLFSDGMLPMDLTQTSYSTVPSIDLEVGDTVSDHSQETHARLAEGITAGLNVYFGQ